MLDAFLNAILTSTHDIHCIRGTALQTFNHGLDLLRRSLRPTGQCSDLVGNDGKTTSLFAGTCRLNCGIQCEQIGLFGDTFDHIENYADIGRIFLKPVQCLASTFDFLGYIFNVSGCLLHDLTPQFRLFARQFCRVCRTTS